MNRFRFLVAGPCCLALTFGCERHDREFEIVEIRQLPSRTSTVGAPPLRREAMEHTRRPTAGATFDFELPDGWETADPEPPRDLALRAPEAVVIGVSRMPGNAGGALANLTRWRGQLGLPPADGAMLADCPRAPLLGGTALRVDLTAADGRRRILGLMACDDGGSTFVKMSGEATAVTAQVEAFDRFAASLRIASTPVEGSDAEGPSTGGLWWTAPPSWVALPPGQFRLAHFQVAPGVQLWISVLAGAGGGTAANVARWCEQYGKPTLDPDAIARLPRTTVLGRAAVSVDLTGEPGSRGMLGVICELEERSVFVKMDGPSEAVRAHAGAFRSFCASLRLPE